MTRAGKARDVGPVLRGSNTAAVPGKWLPESKSQTRAPDSQNFLGAGQADSAPTKNPNAVIGNGVGVRTAYGLRKYHKEISPSPILRIRRIYGWCVWCGARTWNVHQDGKLWVLCRKCRFSPNHLIADNEKTSNMEGNT